MTTSKIEVYHEEILKNIFGQILTSKSDILFKDSDYNNLEDSIMLSDECELYTFLQEILNLTELDAMDLYDLFKYNEFFAISEKSFIMLIFLLASYESGQLEDYIATFHEEMFLTLSGNEKYINLSRLKEVGRVLGFDENVLSKISNELHIELTSCIDQETFKSFYLNIGKIYDEQFKSENIYLQQGGGSKRSQDKAKTSGCMNKACNIL